MGNQAQQRQELELWRVVSPPKNNKTNRPEHQGQETGTCIPKKYKQYKFQEHGGRLAHTASGDSIKIKHLMPRATRPSAPRGQASRAVRPDAARTARPDMPRTSAARSSRQQTYRIDARPATAGQTAARQVRSEYIAFDRERTSPSRTVQDLPQNAGAVPESASVLRFFGLQPCPQRSFYGKSFFQSTKKPPITKKKLLPNHCSTHCL